MVRVVSAGWFPYAWSGVVVTGFALYAWLFGRALEHWEDEET